MLVQTGAAYPSHAACPEVMWQLLESNYPETFKQLTGIPFNQAKINAERASMCGGSYYDCGIREASDACWLALGVEKEQAAQQAKSEAEKAADAQHAAGVAEAHKEKHGGAGAVTVVHSGDTVEEQAAKIHAAIDPPKLGGLPWWAWLLVAAGGLYLLRPTKRTVETITETTEEKR